MNLALYAIQDSKKAPPGRGGAFCYAEAFFLFLISRRASRVAVARRAAMTHFSSSVKVICSAVMAAPSSRVAGVDFRLLPDRTHYTTL